MAITASIEQHGAPVDHVGVDGCGAPTHAIGLADLARSFASIARSQSAVARSMSARPDLVGGRERDVTRWMTALPGLVVKDGADGVMAGAFPDGRAFAVKIAERGRRCTAGRDRRKRCARSAWTSTILTARSPPVRACSVTAGEVGRIEALPWSS